MIPCDPPVGAEPFKGHASGERRAGNHTWVVFVATPWVEMYPYMQEPPRSAVRGFAVLQHGLHASGDLELGEDVIDVRLDRCGGEVELSGELGVVLALCHQPVSYTHLRAHETD